VFVDGTPVNNFETAHIRAANDGGRRYVKDMSDEDRNGFDNLVLLCLVHHKIVDKIRPNDFSIQTLQAWKTTRESAGRAALRGLRGLTEARLQELIAESFTIFKAQFDDALARLESVDIEAARLLRPLIDELAEARFHARFPDEHIASMLADAANKLVNLENHADTLLTAANSLAGLEANAEALMEAADRIQSAQQFM
jgi:hypothetical protein